MRNNIKTRAGIAALVYLMVDAVMFNVGLVAVLMVPYFRANAASGIVAAVVASLLLAASVSWLLAPHLRSRRQQSRVIHAYARRGILIKGARHGPARRQTPSLFRRKDARR